MKFEQDELNLSGGVRHGRSMGGPVAVRIGNTEWPKWVDVMSPEPVSPEALGGGRGAPLTRPRPGHADLVGMQKYGFDEARPVLERASARETAARVAAGGVAKALLRRYGMEIRSHVVQIGAVAAPPRDELTLADFDGVDESPVRCLDPEASAEMRAEIKAAGQSHDTVGGIFEVWAFDAIPGLGSHVAGDARLDGRLGQALLGIQAIKGVEIGAGFELGRIRGSQAHDEIYHEPGRGYHRRSNRSGGIEGGMTHGAPVVVRAVMKPISTLSRPLDSVDVVTKEPRKAHKERSDICAVPAAAVVAEAAVAFVLAQALLEKFGGDSIAHLDEAVARYRAEIAS